MTSKLDILSSPESYIFNSDNWEINNYDEFIKSAYSTGESYMLTEYSKDDLQEKNITTYKLKNANIGFALRPDSNGNDIVLFHNSDDDLKEKHLMKYVIRYAISLGGNHLDYYETPKLKHLYESIGFEEYGRYKFDKMYASLDFDYDKYGEPDVVFIIKFARKPRNL